MLRNVSVLARGVVVLVRLLEAAHGVAEAGSTRNPLLFDLLLDDVLIVGLELRFREKVVRLAGEVPVLQGLVEHGVVVRWLKRELVEVDL